MFKKIRIYIEAFYLTFFAPKKEKVSYFLETTDEHLDMVESLSREFNMTWDELINFLIAKQFYRSSISQNEKLNEKGCVVLNSGVLHML